MNIKTYILNMPQRLERREAIAREFLGRRIFDVEFCEPVHHVNPRISHWLTMQRLAERAMAQQRPCFLFCEDDHIFTEAYSDQLLTSCIREADTLGADLLLGSVSWMFSPIQIRQSLFWLESFNGTQFVIVFNRFYERIVNFHLHANDTVTEMNLVALSHGNIFTIHPFISVQQEFGYSDVTPRNGQKGYVEGLFRNTQRELYCLDKVKMFYAGLQ